MTIPAENINQTRTKEKLGIGSQLRSARLKQELTLNQVSEELCIRLENLKAIEKEDFDALPTGAYALGFIRTYASFLGVNPRFLIDQLVEAGVYEEVSPRVQRTVDIKPTRKAPSIRFTIRSLLAVFVGLGLFYIVSSDGDAIQVKLDESAKASSQNVAKLLENGASALSTVGDVMESAVKSGVETLHKIEADKLKVAQTVNTVNHQVTETQKLRDATEKKTLAQNNAGEEHGVDLLASLIDESSEVVVSSKENLEPVAEAKSSVDDVKVITLAASEDVWLSVYDADTKSSYKTLVLKNGQKQNITLKDNMQIDIGRPAGLSISANGKNYGVMGPEWGGVIRRMPFNADFIINEFYATGGNKKSYNKWIKEHKIAHSN